MALGGLSVGRRFSFVIREDSAPLIKLYLERAKKATLFGAAWNLRQVMNVYSLRGRQKSWRPLGIHEDP